MGILKDIVQSFTYYVLNNSLEIDNSTFLTIVIGQIAIYGILLTFYQFVASYKGSEKAATRYLGINGTEYFIMKNVSAFNKIVSKKWFGFMFVLEILYKPITVIFNNMFSARLSSVINFVWYVFVIFYFVIFVILFFNARNAFWLLNSVLTQKQMEA